MNTTTDTAAQPANPLDDWSDDRWAALYADLRGLQALCSDANSNDQLFVLINACIDNGINTVGRVIRVLQPLGFSNDRIGAYLRGTLGRRRRKEMRGVLGASDGAPASIGSPRWTTRRWRCPM